MRQIRHIQALVARSGMQVYVPVQNMGVDLTDIAVHHDPSKDPSISVTLEGYITGTKDRISLPVPTRQQIIHTGYWAGK